MLIPFPHRSMAMFSVWMLILIPLTSWNCASGCMWMKPQSKASLSNFQVLSNSSIVHLQQAVSKVRQSQFAGVMKSAGHKMYKMQNILKVSCLIWFQCRVAVLEHGYLSMEFPHKQYNLITQLQVRTQ